MPEVKITFDAADDYERYMGRWSRAIGEKFLSWLDAPKGARWLDVGCGTGAFSELILRHGAQQSLTGIDPSPEQIAYAKKQLRDLTFKVADSMELPFGQSEFDVVASALVIHFIPDRARAFAEMHRVLRPGGLIAGYTWKRNAAANFAPYAPMLRAARSLGGEPMSSPLVPEGTPEGMRATLAAAGFTDIVVTEIDVTRTFASFDEYWEIQTMPFSPSGKTVAKLTDAQRAKLREAMREKLPAAADGSVTYAATAMAGKARKA